MSTIQMIVDVCTCCDRPVYQCNVAKLWIRLGVPLTEFTVERVYPSEIHYEGTSKEVSRGGSV